MAKRWPNLLHWQLLENVYRATDHDSWRVWAAADLGVAKKDLRCSFDRPLDAQELDTLLAQLKRRADQHRAFIEREYLANLAAVQSAVHEAQYDLRHAVMLEAAAENEKRDLADWIASPVYARERAFFADLLAEEAA